MPPSVIRRQALAAWLCAAGLAWAWAGPVHAEQWYGSSSDRRTGYDRTIQDLEDQQADRDRAARAWSAPSSGYQVPPDQAYRDQVQEQQRRDLEDWYAKHDSSTSSTPAAPSVPHPETSESAVIGHAQSTLKSAADWLDGY